MAFASRNRSRILIGAALLAGVFGGVMLSRGHNPEFAFLEGTRPIAVRDASVLTSTGVIRGTTTYFTFEGDWNAVYEKAKAEMPGVIERETQVGGVAARVLTVPRIEDGRMRLFFPPVREITIMPQRIVLTEGGQVLARQEPNRHWASVRISEYHQPHALQQAMDWFRDTLDI